MDIYKSLIGHRYDDGEPLHMMCTGSSLAFNRITGHWLDMPSYLAAAANEGHTIQPREFGIPSIGWQLSRLPTGDFNWGPGGDDTSGLASEAVSNGEDWVDADTGSQTTTPPTGWALVGDTTCQNIAGVLHLHAHPVTGGGMTQSIAGTPGAIYVLEINVGTGTTSDVSILLDDVGPLSVGPSGSEPVRAVAFTMPADGDVKLAVGLTGGGEATIDYVRCYLESELSAGA